MNERKYDLRIDWVLNHSCNLRCPYCFLPLKERIKKPSFTKEKFFETLHFFKDLKKKEKKTAIITLTGGEPLINEGIIEFIEEVTKYHYISLITNLTTNNVYEFAEKINPQKVNFVYCSLHYTELKRLNLIDDFLKKIDFLKKKGFNIMVTIVMWPPLIKDFSKIYNFFKSNNIVLIPKGFIGVYNGKTYPESYSKKEAKLMEYYKNLSESSKIFKKSIKKSIKPSYKIISKRKKKIKDLFRGGRLSYQGKKCYAGVYYIKISIRGDVLRCSSIRNKPMGNVFDNNIKFLKEPKPCPVKICECAEEGMGLAVGDAKVIKNNFIKKLLNEIF